jgi:glycosyltransferase involved in cell wall biosynthesis
MNIAYVVPYVPNLIRTRPYNLIRQLAALGNEITVYTLGSGKQDREDAEALRLKVSQLYYQEQSIWYSLWNSIKAVPSRRPLQTVYSWNPHLAGRFVKSISDDLGAFDIVHIEHLRGSRYGQFIRSRFPHIPLVWDSVDCISYLFRQASAYSTGVFGRFVTGFELSRTQKMEEKLIGDFDRVFVTSETDKNALLELALPTVKPAPISVLSNGVDLEYFHQNPWYQRDLNTLIFSGKMSYHANITMAKYLVAEIMPRIWEKHPNVRLMIVGKDPTSEVRTLGVDPRITVTGTVNDIRPFLWEATVAVIPLVYGAGIQNKVLEAMACGTPVVTTSKTISSLQVTAGKDLLIADGAVQFSENVIKLLGNRKLQIEIGSNGASYVRSCHSWTDMAKQLLAYYNETIEKLNGTTFSIPEGH